MHLIQKSMAWLFWRTGAFRPELSYGLPLTCPSLAHAKPDRQSDTHPPSIGTAEALSNISNRPNTQPPLNSDECVWNGVELLQNLSSWPGFISDPDGGYDCNIVGQYIQSYNVGFEGYYTAFLYSPVNPRTPLTRCPFAVRNPSMLSSRTWR